MEIDELKYRKKAKEFVLEYYGQICDLYEIMKQID